MAKKQISVQAHADYIDDVNGIAEKLKSSGMSIKEEMKSLGHFRGIADENVIENLKTIPGVADVDIIGEAGIEPDDYSVDNA